MTCEGGHSCTSNARDRLRIARGLLLAAFAATASSSSGCSDGTTTLTGTWKANCNDYWGILIKPAGRGLYAVTFCGLSGCLEPGEWTPNTRIEGDPMYQVVSPRKIRIRRKDHGYFTYVKCSADAVWRASN